MIHVYPVEVEAYDEDHQKIFSLHTFDEGSAELKADTLVTLETINEFCEALKQGVHLLRLESK